MDSKNALALAIAALEALPTLVKLTTDTAKWVTDTIAILRTAQAGDGSVAPAVWDDFNFRIEDLRAQRRDPGNEPD